MALTFIKLFVPSQLSTSASLIFTVPTAPATTLLRNGRVRLTNITGAAAAATLYAVPNTSTPGNANNCFPSVSIGPNAYQDVDLPQMAAGDALWAFSGSAASISISAIDGAYQS